MPAAAAGIAKCSRGAKSKLRGAPQRRSSTLAVSSAPSGTSSSGQVRHAHQKVAQRGVGLGGLGLEPGDLVLLRRRRARAAARTRPRRRAPWRRRPRGSRRCARRARSRRRGSARGGVSSRPRMVSASGSSPRRVEAVVEGVGGLADHSDVVHGRVSGSGGRAGLWPRTLRDQRPICAAVARRPCARSRGRGILAP